MHEIVKILTVLPLMVLFFDYAVAMQKVAPCGTRRALNTFSRQSIVSVVKVSQPVYLQGLRWTDKAAA